MRRRITHAVAILLAVFTYVLAAPSCNDTNVPLDKFDNAIIMELLTQVNYAPWTRYLTAPEDPCSWNGIQCACGRVIGVTIELDPIDGTVNNMVNLLPESIVGLTELNALVIECSIGASLYGSVPPQLMDGSMRHLTLLSFAGCGQITSDISTWNLTRTVYSHIDLSGNQIYGDISNLVCPEIISIDVTYNQITGTIPWQGCVCAIKLGLSFNKISSLGSISNFDCHIHVDPYRADRVIDARANGMTGNLDDISMVFEQYGIVSLAHNMITGTIPSSVYCSEALFASFDFTHNQLTGVIPNATVMRSFPNDSLSCVSLYVARNQLEGLVPVIAPGGCLELDASFNYLTGFVNEDKALAGYVTLMVGHNRLTGSLPRVLVHELNSIDVSYNQLTGCPFAPATCPNEDGMNDEHDWGVDDTTTVSSNPSTFTPPSTATSSSSLAQKLALNTIRLDFNNFSCPIGVCKPPWARSIGISNLVISGGDYSGLELQLINAGKIEAVNCNLQGNLLLSGFTTRAFLSFNKYNGSLPSLTGHVASHTSTTVTIGSAVEVLDVSFNAFVGGLRFALKEYASSSTTDVSASISLAQLNITGNALTEAESLINFVSASDVSYVGADFTCPAVNILGEITLVYVSPEFYAYERCSCNSLFFGGPIPGGYNCTSLSSICDEFACFDLENTTSSRIMVLSGYYPRPAFNATTSLVACPLINPSKVTYACGGQCACTGNVGYLDCVCNDLCSTGYEDLFCSRCGDGYFALGWLCLECDASANLTAVCIAAGCLLLSLFGMVWSSSSTPQQRATRGSCLWLRQNKVMSSIVFAELILLTVVSLVMNVANVGVIGVAVLLALLLQLAWHQSGPASDPAKKPVDMRALTILITFLQTIAAGVPSGFWTFEGHETTLQAHRSAPSWHVVGPSAARAIAELNPFGVECYMETVQIEVFFYWTLIVQFFMNGLLLIGFGLSKLRFMRMRSSEQNAPIKAALIRTRTAMIYVINYLIFNAFVVVIQLFNCNQTGSEEYYLLSYPWVQCFSPRWYQLLAVGLAVMILYISAVVTFSWYMRKTMMRKGIDVMRSRFSFFVSPFKEQQWWFGLVILGRRLLLAIGLSGFPSEASTGPLVVLGALVLGLVAQTTAWPYSHPALNWIETTQLSILIITYSAVVLLNAGFVTFNLLTRIALLLVNVIFVIVAIVYTLSPTLRRLFAKKTTTTTGEEAEASETSSLVEHWMDTRKRLNSAESVRVRDLEEENATLHKRIVALETEVTTLRRINSVAQTST